MYSHTDSAWEGVGGGGDTIGGGGVGEPRTGIKYGQASGVVGGGGGSWRVRRGVGAVGAAAGETARRHRPGQQSTQTLRKP